MDWFRRYRWDVFISYSHADEAKAEALARSLAGAGFSCWLDKEQLRASVHYDQEIVQVIRESCVMVALLSRAALGSRYVNHEVSTALGAGTPVAPCYLEKIPASELKEPFAVRLADPSVRRTHARFLDDPATEAAEQARLIDDLRGLRRERRTGWWRRLAAATACVAALLTLVLVVQNAMVKRTWVDVLKTLQPPQDLLVQARERPAFWFSTHWFQTSTSNWFPITEDIRLVSGDKICLKAQTFTPGYLYLFHLDSAGRLEWLFPRNETSKFSAGANPVAANTNVSFPQAEKSGFPLDQAIGTEQSFAVFSAVAWPELETALREGGSKPAMSAREIQKLLAALATVAARGKGLGTEEPVGVAQPAGPGDPPSLRRANGDWLMEVRGFQHVAAR